MNTREVDLEFVEADWMYRFIDPCRILVLGYLFFLFWSDAWDTKSNYLDQ